MYICYYRSMRTTLTINDEIFRALKIRAAESDETISKYVEDAIKYQLLEDAEDIEDARKRQDEPEYPFEDLVKKFKSEGLL